MALSFLYVHIDLLLSSNHFHMIASFYSNYHIKIANKERIQTKIVGVFLIMLYFT